MPLTFARAVGVSVLAAGACTPHAGATRAGLALPEGTRRAPSVAAGHAHREPPTYAVAARGDPLEPGLALGEAETGHVVDGARVVSSRHGLRVAREAALGGLTRAVVVPTRLGGGFVFSNETALYFSRTFDGELKPLAYFPESKIVGVDFGFDRALVRAADGRRWMIRVPSGERVDVEPMGLVEIEARDDGLGLALTDAGRLYATRDSGVAWQDVTSQVSSAPDDFRQREDAIYVTLVGGLALRLGPDARLARVPEVPGEVGRSRDPRWRGSGSPLHAAIRSGVLAEDPDVALVAASGELVRVSLRSGEIVSVQSGELPLDAICEGVRAWNDALFVCKVHGSAPRRFVVSGTLYGKTPRLEHSFAGAGMFSASDEGALAYAGPCAGPPREGVACVRLPTGAWLERGGAPSDAGVTAPLGYVIPRVDGSASSLSFRGRSATIVDLVTGGVRTLTDGDFPEESAERPGGPGLVRREWTSSASGALLGWRGGRFVAIPAVGDASSSTFLGDGALYGLSGARGVGMTDRGQLFQTVDHGATWLEVAPPPSQSTVAARTASEIHCSDVGCSLGPWLRVGFPEEPPPPPSHQVAVPPPPAMKAFATAKLFSCEPQGANRGRTLPAQGELEFGFGASLAPSSREVFHTPRGPIHPVPLEVGDTPGATRAVGISREPALARTITYLAPFDPRAAPRTGTLLPADVLRAFDGNEPEEVIYHGFSATVPITPIEPAAAGGLLFFGDYGHFFVLRGGAARVSVVPPRERDLKPISAVELPGERLAVLMSDGWRSSVFRVSRGGALTTAMTWAGAKDTHRYPHNPDALAVGPRGELGVIRMASGAEPASARDPARLFLEKGEARTLAPWSTLSSARSAECRADRSGFRATLEVHDWVRADGDLELERPSARSPALVRVRWGESRVCLEALEVRTSDWLSDLWSGAFERWAVHRELPVPQTSLLAVGPGFEFRQAARCSLH